MQCKGLSLMSGGLDSQLAVRVLQAAGAEVEAICFVTPFFSAEGARKAAKALGVKLHEVDFTEDIIRLLENPPHGFGGAMNPCIDCHAMMIRRAGERMLQYGYDFVATGEVQGQRPMSQNRQALGVVEKCSGLQGRLVRPLSAKLLTPTLPELSGQLKREKLLDFSGRARDRQIALAATLGLVDYPAPAGGCKLTEAGFARKLLDLKIHEGLQDRRLVNLLVVARRFRLPGGTSVLLGRDQVENECLKAVNGPGVLISPRTMPGPTAFVPWVRSAEDLVLTHGLVGAYSRVDQSSGEIVLVEQTLGGLSREVVVAPPYRREVFKQYQIM